MALDKDDILFLIENTKKLREFFELFKQHNLNTISSNYSEEDEKQANTNFMAAYGKKIRLFIESKKIDVKGPAFTEAMKKYGTSDFIDVYTSTKESVADKEMNPLDDPTLTKAQRTGLKQFHKWLYRNADKTGFIGLGNNGSMRDFANEFVKQPAAVQLKTLYLLETGKRKDPDLSGKDDYLSQIEYVPNLKKIKRPLIASKWKFWKRTNGTHLYWDKLSDSLNQAKENKDELTELREEMAKNITTEEARKAHAENGYTVNEKAAAIEKLLKTDQLYKEDGEVDDEKVARIKQIKEFARKVNSLQVSEETKNEAKNQLMDIIAHEIGVEIHGDKKRTLKGFGDFVEEGILGGEDNYYNAEYALQGVIKTIASDKAFTDLPGIKDIISGNPIANVPGALFDGVAVLNDLVGIYQGFKEIKSSFKEGGIATGVSNILDIAGNVTDIAYRGYSQYVNVAEHILEESDEVLEHMGTVANNIYGVYNVIDTINNTVKVIDKSAKIKHAENAMENKAVKNIAEFSKFKNSRERSSAGVGIAKGVAGSIYGFCAGMIGTTPVLGQLVLAGLVGTSIISQVKDEKDRRDIAREAVDKILFNSDKQLGATSENFASKLNGRLAKYEPGSKEYKKIESMIKNADQRKDKVRNEKAVKNGCTSLFASTGTIMGMIGEDLMKKLYLRDEKLGFVAGNIIEREDEITSSREKTSYKELLESFGVKTKLSKEKLTTKAAAKRFENEVKKMSM